MAAPHVSGACALLEAHYPNENYRQIINRILSNVDLIPSLAGKCVSGGRLNLQKALGVSTPPPPTRPTVTVTATDANASEQGPDTGTFTIRRTGNVSSALTVYAGRRDTEWNRLPATGNFGDYRCRRFVCHRHGQTDRRQSSRRRRDGGAHAVVGAAFGRGSGTSATAQRTARRRTPSTPTPARARSRPRSR